MGNLSWEKAALSAKAAKLAYDDHAKGKKFFQEHGYKHYQFLDVDGAQAHLAANDTEVIFAFRGTEPKQISDLLADLNTIPKRHGPGFVHGGFRKEARKLWSQVEKWANKHKGKSFIICGHSLGAAMATYTAQELRYASHEDIVLYTFGSPRLGSPDYVEGMDVPHWRFVNNNDGVTHVPPSLIGFKHHGELKYINYYGNIRPLSRWQRIKDMWRGYWAAAKKFQLFDWMYDHSMDAYVKKVVKAAENN